MKRLILDVSSICWMNLLAGKDEENGKQVEHEGRKVLVNSAAFGYENALNHLLAAMRQFQAVPHQLIFVVEGKSSKKFRQVMLPCYKEGRDSRPDEAYEQFNTLKVKLVETFCNLGACAVTQDGIEADDVIAYLAQNLAGERIILSNDGDLSVLVGGDVHLWRRDELDANPYGPFPPQYITLYKALVGDTSDSIPGAKGFGPKAFLDLLCVFGEDGLGLMLEMIAKKDLARLSEDVGDLKSLQKVIDGADMVYASYAAAKLYPEKINTMRKPLEWTAGMVKPLSPDGDARLRPWAGQVRLIHAGNYAEAMAWATDKIAASPFVSLDIETSTPPESDEWLETAKGKAEDGDLGVDVFGSELTGLSLTFGENSQYTFYLTHDHAGEGNLTIEQVRDFVARVPKDKVIVVHNASFELSVIYQEWGQSWADDPVYHGFLPNIHDTTILFSYVDENQSRGLKKLSARLLRYEQETYEHVTVLTGVDTDLPAGGRVIEVYPELGEVKKRYKMNELTAQHVLAYGADDAICTAALYNHARVICEIEKAWEVYKEVEVYPAYLAALAFVQGTPISLERMFEIEKDDDATRGKAWGTIRTYLMGHGWEGTVCPVFTELDAKSIKEIFYLVTGKELKTQVRTPEKLIKLVEVAEHDDAALLARFMATGDLHQINDWIRSTYRDEPVIDFDSPKQMKELLYTVMALPIRLVNKATATEREKKPELAKAVQKFNKIRQGSKDITLTAKESEILKAKAKTDDFALDFALAFDRDVANVPVLEAIQSLKTVETRRKLFYKPYRHVRHWKDGRVHSSLNQCAAVTRRYSSSGPNLQQLPKKGEGVKFRGIFVPHCKDGVIISLDFSGQELRLMAEQSQDSNMLACYIGDKLKDIHSITASGAMRKKWGAEWVDRLFAEDGVDPAQPESAYNLFIKLRKSEDEAIAKKADDLRKDGKNVNFAAQFDAQAVKLSEMLVISVEEAQMFLDAKYAMFPGVETWKDDVRSRLLHDGYVTTMMGARRHLAHAVLAEDKWEAERAGRQGPNFMIQGSAAEMSKLAMTRLWKSGVMFRCNARFIGPVHDELVVSAHRDDVLEVVRVMNDCMTGDYAGMRVPLIASISLGRNFAEQIECGDTFDAAAIQRALDQCFVEETATA